MNLSDALDQVVVSFMEILCINGITKYSIANDLSSKLITLLIYLVILIFIFFSLFGMSSIVHKEIVLFF